jgi:hypothetical protein
MPAPPAHGAELARGAEGEALRALAWARVAVGALFLFRTTPLIGLFDPGIGADARPLYGWPPPGDAVALGLGLSAPALKALCLVRTAGLAAFLLGVGARVAGLVAVAAGYLVLFQAPFGFTATQHLLLQATALLSLADASSRLAILPAVPRSPRSSLWMVRAFVASVYAWAGVAKLRPDWLDGRTLLLFHEEQKLRGPLAEALLGSPARAAIAGPLVALGELALGPLLLVPRTRPLGLSIAVAFHLGIEWMGHPDVIGWVMLCLLVVFLRVEDPPPRG